MYMLKLLFKVVTTGIDALVSRNEFLYTYVKEVCLLLAQPRFDTFYQLLISVEALWSRSVLQVGKQVVVAWSEGGQTTPSWNAPAVNGCKQLYAEEHYYA
jgi:hypothetical protein